MSKTKEKQSILKTALLAWVEQQPIIQLEGYSANEKLINLAGLADLFKAIGYPLQCHQRGIAGTLLLTEPLKKKQP